MLPRMFASVALLTPLLIAAGPASVVTPGKWENRIDIIDVKLEGGPPGLAKAIMGKPIVVTSCITPAQATMGPKSLFKANKGCRVVRYQAAAGKISSEFVCTRPGGAQRVVSSGSYSADRYAVISKGVMTGQMSMTTTSRTTGRRIGGC